MLLVRRSLIRLGDRKAPVPRCETAVGRGGKKGCAGAGPGVDIIENDARSSSKCHVDTVLVVTVGGGSSSQPAVSKQQ